MGLKSTAFVLAAIALSSCTTIQTAPQRGTAAVNTEKFMPVPKTRGEGLDSGVVFAYQFQGTGVPADGACRMRIIKKDTGRSFIVTLQTSVNAAFAPLEPGIYEAGRLGCSVTRLYEMTDLYPQGFEVRAGQVGYLGKLIFKFDGKNLIEVNKAGRSESAASYETVSAIIPPGAALVSAFTLAPLTNEMASEGSNSNGFNVRAKGIQGPSLDTLLSELQRCEKNVAKADPLRFGTLDYTATYKSGRFADFKERRDTNAFPEMLRDCVSETLSKFQPEAKSAVEIRVVY